MGKFYTYKYTYPEEMGGEVFYIGKGSGSRINVHEWEASRGYKGLRFDVIRSIWAAGYKPVKSIVFETDIEQEAIDRERELIAFHSVTLTNVIDNTAVNPIPRTPKVKKAPREERLALAIEGVKLRHRSAALSLPEGARERTIKIWDERVIRHLRQEFR